MLKLFFYWLDGNVIEVYLLYSHGKISESNKNVILLDSLSFCDFGGRNLSLSSSISLYSRKSLMASLLTDEVKTVSQLSAWLIEESILTLYAELAKGFCIDNHQSSMAAGAFGAGQRLPCAIKNELEVFGVLGETLTNPRWEHYFASN